jgi:hypothetical protein
VIADVGDLVAYEDQANPRTVYRVVALPAVLRIGGQPNQTDYRLHEVETEEVTWSDLRQAGWTRVCSECDRVKANGGFGPPHNASPRCQSGGHNHCTCDTCF